MNDLDDLSRASLAFSASERARIIDRSFGPHGPPTACDLAQLETLGVHRADLRLLGHVLEKREIDLALADDPATDGPARDFDALCRLARSGGDPINSRRALDKVYAAGGLGLGPVAIARHQTLAAEMIAMSNPDLG